MNILMADVGGTNVKLMVSGSPEIRKIPSGQEFSAPKMVKELLGSTRDWDYEAISVGFPGRVSRGLPCTEPLNLGGGWLEFDYATALGKRFDSSMTLRSRR